ncbi:TPA: hypothetical protein IF864_003831 [Escherichia coli]|nr:hypothetical protein EIA22_08080 [Escherichia coli]TFM82533.1 hypothetical protein ELX67_06580 [Escherichia coli]HAM5180967.1 hypothetical protein [Escherichia coli]HAN7733296.1 hypothetical protein [Escherichia coli]HAN7772327.1 hypothetical protein [Escherichia coli]
MSNNVKLQVLLRAVDQASRPFKSIRTASKSLSGDIRETQKSLRELNGQASRIAEFSISLATGRADIYTETPVKVSGFKRVIDEQDWTITKVTHCLNNSGFTTSLELEVRLSDVEYETEDDE